MLGRIELPSLEGLRDPRFQIFLTFAPSRFIQSFVTRDRPCFFEEHAGQPILFVGEYLVEETDEATPS